MVANGSYTAHGRTFNDASETYMLPGDDDELERLTLQHSTLLAILDRLYPCDPALVHEVLKPNPDAPPAVLDIGSGSGIWAIQMSKEFVHARVVGVDIARSNPRHCPPNCTFDAGDVTRGLQRYHGSFNIVHCRCMAGAVRDFRALVHELALCLRPGGILIMAEGDLKVYNEQKHPAALARDADTDPTHSWLARLLFEVAQLNARRDVVSMGWHLEHHLREARGMFRDVCSERKYAPIGWAGDGSLKNGETVGYLMKLNCTDFVRAWRPLLLLHNFPPELVDQWIANIDAELHDPTNGALRQYTVWHYAWAVRGEEPSWPPPPPPPDEYWGHRPLDLHLQ